MPNLQLRSLPGSPWPPLHAAPRRRSTTSTPATRTLTTKSLKSSTSRSDRWPAAIAAARPPRRRSWRPPWARWRCLPTGRWGRRSDTTSSLSVLPQSTCGKLELCSAHSEGAVSASEWRITAGGILSRRGPSTSNSRATYKFCVNYRINFCYCTVILLKRIPPFLCFIITWYLFSKICRNRSSFCAALTGWPNRCLLSQAPVKRHLSSKFRFQTHSVIFFFFRATPMWSCALVLSCRPQETRVRQVVDRRRVTAPPAGVSLPARLSRRMKKFILKWH